MTTTYAFSALISSSCVTAATTVYLSINLFIFLSIYLCISLLAISNMINILSCLLLQELSSVLDALGTALQTPSYWLRLCLLKLLCFLPNPSLRAVEGGKADGSEARTVKIAQLCLEAACTPAELKAEREFSRRTGKLEIHIRSGRLPSAYVRIVCSMCLGLLNVKFKPFWEPSVLLLIAAAGSKEGEAVLWPLLLEFIQTSSRKTDDGTQLNQKKIKPILDEVASYLPILTDC